VRVPRAFVAAALLGPAVVAGACTPGTVTPVPPTPAPTAPAGTPEAAAGAIQVALVNSDLAVGPERFAFAILDAAGALIADADVEVTFFRLDGETADPVSTGRATFYPAVLEPAGLYVVHADFDSAGPWGAEIEPTLPDGSQPTPQRVRFEVAEDPAAPAVGERPPPTANRTLDDVDDIAALTSDPQPDPDLYRLTVDEAAASGRPTVVVFATPAYCQSQICGPVLDEVKHVKAAWGDRVNFIHIEVYQDFEALTLADEMAAWGLKTEPWVFVLDAEGRVAERMEASVTAAELEPVLERVAGGA
jgi:hypothetical protein